MQEFEDGFVGEMVGEEGAEEDVGGAVEFCGEDVCGDPGDGGGGEVLLAVALAGEAGGVGIDVYAGEAEGDAALCGPAGDVTEGVAVAAGGVDDVKRLVCDAGVLQDAGEEVERWLVAACPAIEAGEAEGGGAVGGIGAGFVHSLAEGELAVGEIGCGCRWLRGLVRPWWSGCAGFCVDFGV